MKKLFLIALLLQYISLSQNIQRGIDEVLLFIPGEGQSLGQDPQYFPMNIFALPDTNANENIPASSPENICSIGLGGEIIVGFSGLLLYNGTGPDFTVFENAFINPVTGKVFAEPAIVSVSTDGVHFVDFPCDTLTLEGCAGKTPTYGKNNPFNPLISGGDSFDINDLGLEYIKYIKIKDISDKVLNNPAHPYYDPIISGFDLDAVVGLNLHNSTSVLLNNTQSDLSGNELIFDKLDYIQIDIFGSDGRLINQFTPPTKILTELNSLAAGLYFIIIKNWENTHTIKYLKYE